MPLQALVRARAGSALRELPWVHSRQQLWALQQGQLGAWCLRHTAFWISRASSCWLGAWRGYKCLCLLVLTAGVFGAHQDLQLQATAGRAAGHPQLVACRQHLHVLPEAAWLA